MAFMAATACAVAPGPEPAPAAARSSSAQAEPAAPGDDVAIPDELTPDNGPTICGSATRRCVTASACHHSEGIDVGTFDCAAGLICCAF
jgi:hypothetical protein